MSGATLGAGAGLLPGGERRTAAFAAAGILVALFAYLHGLGQPFIPSIGDEPLYLQIVRNTWGSGRLLPLLSDTGITDTKPPLLFWQGIAAARLAGLDLAWLRLPNVLLTFATAVAAGWLAARTTGRRAAGVVAALAFLAFRSTLQHGRPFLTNAGETLFLFLPLVLLHGRTRPTLRLAVACGASLGLAALYKSFAVVLPGTLAMAFLLFFRGEEGPRAFLRRWSPFLAGAAAVGLALFATWLLLDPRPDLVLSQFVWGENAGKFRSGGYLAGLFTGPYPIWRIWLGPVLNAGLLAPVVVGLAVDLWRRRRALPLAEKELWGWILAFLLFYSLPAQRQENYLLPTSAALAVLLAVRWEAIAASWFRLALVPLAAAAAVLPLFEAAVSRAAGERLWSPWAWLPPAALALLAAAGAWRPRLGRALLPVCGLLALVVISSFLAPFSRPFGEEVLGALRGRTVLFPDRFQRAQELYRYMTPGADVRGWACPPGPCDRPPAEAVSPGSLAALLLPDRNAPAGWERLADRPHLRNRHTPGEIRAIAGGDLSLLVERLVIVRRLP